MAEKAPATKKKSSGPTEKSKAKTELRASQLELAQNEAAEFRNASDGQVSLTALIRHLAKKKHDVNAIASCIDRPYRQVYGILWKDRNPDKVVKAASSKKAPKKAAKKGKASAAK